jgi:hypothetical protein
VVEAGQSQMNWILSGSTCILCSSTMYPKYWTIFIPKEYFFKLAYSLCCRRVLKTYLICCMCSSQVLLKMRMSSKYITTKELLKGLNTSSLNLMKMVGAFDKPKGMTNHSNRPSLDLKVVFHTSIGFMGNWW